MPDPLFDRPLIAMVGWLEVLGALMPQVSVGVAKQHFPISSYNWSKVTAGPGPRSLGSFGP